MQGFAVVDNQPGNGQTAVWLTSRIAPQHADHTNAVVTGTTSPDAYEKLRSLTRTRVVVLTESSSIDGLPIDGECMSISDVDSLISETLEYQDRILRAIAAYATRTRNRSLVSPEFPLPSKLESFAPPEDTAAQRALQAANYLARAWTAWLTTEEQRRRRTVQPRTGLTPWIMPDDMNSPDIAELPPRFAQQLYVQPLA